MLSFSLRGPEGIEVVWKLWLQVPVWKKFYCALGRCQLSTYWNLKRKDDKLIIKISTTVIKTITAIKKILCVTVQNQKRNRRKHFSVIITLQTNEKRYIISFWG